MDREVSRRQFVASGAAAGTVLAGTSALTADRADAPAVRRHSVRLDLLTAREVGEWMKTKAVVFVPHGPISGHGPWTTLGVHAHGAEAVATLLARKCDGVVYPPLFTCFAGA